MFATRSRAGGAQRCLRAWLAGGGAGFALLLGSCSAPVGHTATLPSNNLTSVPPSHSRNTFKVRAKVPTNYSETRSGAANFVRNYYMVSNVALSTGSVIKLRSLSLSSCTVCQNFISYIEKQITPKGKVVGQGYYLMRVESTPIVGNAEPVSVTYRVGAQKLIGRNGQTLQWSPPIGPQTVTVVVVWFKGRWYVDQIQI